MVARAKGVRRGPDGLAGIAGTGRAVRDRSATAVAEAFARTAGGNRRSRQQGGCAGLLCLALLCLAPAGRSAAQVVEYRCFPESAPAAKLAGSASASLAYRGLNYNFRKWRDRRVAVTIDHRGAPEGYAKADYEALLLSVFEEVEALADLTFEYRPIPGDGELDDEALDEAYGNFPGIQFAWEDVEEFTNRFAGLAATGTRVRGLSSDEQNAHNEKMQLELGYIPTAWARIEIATPVFSNYLEGDPAGARYLIVHELLHGLGLDHSDNPLSIMHGAPYRQDRGGLHADDVAGLQALYGLPDELVLPAVDLGSAPAGVGLDASNSGFLFWAGVGGAASITDEIIHVPLDRVGNSAALFHWMDGVSYNDHLSRPRLELHVCVTGLPTGSPVSVSVYQTSPRGEVFRYLDDSEDEFSTASPPWRCADGTARRRHLGHYDYYAAQPGSWKFAIGVNGGLLADVMVDIDTAARPSYEPMSRGSLAVARRGDGAFDLEARFADVAGPDGAGYGHDWHIPGYEAYDPRYGPPPEEQRVQGVTYIPRGGLSARVELAGPGVYEVFAEARKARGYWNQGFGFTALARGYLAVPRESGVPSLFGGDGEDSFLHVPAVDVSGSALAAALEGAGADVSGGHVELVLKRTGHGGEQYKLIEARGVPMPSEAAASVDASGQLALGDVAGAGGMRRSMTLAFVPGSNPLRFATGSPGPSTTEMPTSSPDAPAIPSLPALETVRAVPLLAPAKWPAGEAVRVAYVHDYELANFSEAEIREEFFLPALRIIEGAADVTFRVVDHDPEDGPFAGIMIHLLSGEDPLLTTFHEIGPALESYFGEALEHWQSPVNHINTWGVNDPQLGIREIRAAWINLIGEGANGEHVEGLKEANGEAGDAWDRNQWIRAFIKPLMRALGVDLPWRASAPPYLPEAGEIEALQALYGPSGEPVQATEIFDPLGFEFVAEDLGLSLVMEGNDAPRFFGSSGEFDLEHEFEADEDGKIAVDLWRLGLLGNLSLYVAANIAEPGLDMTGIDFGEDIADRLHEHYGFRAYFVNPAGHLARIFESEGVLLEGWSLGKIGNDSLLWFSGRMTWGIGGLLASSPGTWQGLITVRGKTLYEFELEVDASHGAPASFNKPPEVELSLAALGGGRFRLAIDAEDPEGDPFLLGWAGPGREPEIPVDLNRTWRENLPEPAVLDYTELEPGVYQVFATALGRGRTGADWRSAYIVVPRRPGAASYFQAEGILHLPAVRTDNGVREWNLKRVGGGGEGDIRFALLDSKRVEGDGIAAMESDSQTGLFHLGALPGLGRDCAAARLAEIPGTDPPQLRLSGCEEALNSSTDNANAVPTLNFPALPEATAYVGLPFSYLLGGNVFSDGDFDALRFLAAMADGGELPAWLSFDGDSGEFRGVPEAGDVSEAALVIDLRAYDGIDVSAPARLALTVAPVPAPVAATGIFSPNSAAVTLPHVSIQLDGLESRTCMPANIFTLEGGFSSWEMVYDLDRSGRCAVSSAGRHGMPVIEGHAGAMVLSVPLVELAGSAGRLCLAMEFALDGADFQILRLVEVAAVACPAQGP